MEKILIWTICRLSERDGKWTSCSLLDSLSSRMWNHKQLTESCQTTHRVFLSSSEIMTSTPSATSASNPAPSASSECTAAHHDDPRVERTRSAVIEAAVELLMGDGPSAVTHANVATAANVSRTTAYKHWPTRADLLRSTIEAIQKTSPPRTPLTGEVRADLELLFTHMIDDLADDQRAPLMAIMMERALHDPTVTAVRDGLMADFQPVFETIIRSGIDSGEIRRDIDLDVALAAIVGSFLFVRFMSPQRFDAETARRILDEFVATNRPR